MFAQSKGGNYSLTNNGASGVADAIDFDGVTDYLSRSSDLVGNADGKTFTFSAWVWWNSTTTTPNHIYTAGEGGVDYFDVQSINNAGYTQLYIIAKSSAGPDILSAYTSVPNLPDKSWLHILISVDLSSATKRHIIVNDIVTSASWATYTNSAIDFTRIQHSVGRRSFGDQFIRGRLSHVFLAYEYVDLSVEANRRLFITADRKPALNQQALNPILYLPLSDPTQPGKNLGTGGDFALNGVVARSGRGPSQFNAPYSDLDGAADYLSRTSITGIADGKTFTFSCVFSYNALNTWCVWAGSSSSAKVAIGTLGGQLLIQGGDTGSGVAFRFRSTNGLVIKRNYHVAVSCDLADISKRNVLVNGTAISGSWELYNNTNIDLSKPWYIGRDDATAYFNGRLGNVFFDTKYIDLSQPANLAKFVTGTGIDAKPVDLGANGEKPFGTPPLIYLPMYGNNAGKNYGTGGDFVVNSGPFPGARGPNEYWGNKADFDGSTGYLRKTGPLAGIANGKTFSCSFCLLPDASGASYIIFSNTSDFRFFISRGTTNLINITAKNTAGTSILTANPSITVLGGTSAFVQVCVDLADTGKRFMYINGVLDSGVTWTTYTNDSIDFANASANPSIGNNPNNTSYLDGKLSEFYFTTDYIDFSQEANRLKFRDAFGNPADLAPQIAAGTLPNPAIYMRFDPANFGKNSGTGGDFVVNGTITDGGQL